jgi:hypothetical protein
VSAPGAKGTFTNTASADKLLAGCLLVQRYSSVQSLLAQRAVLLITSRKWPAGLGGEGRPDALGNKVGMMYDVSKASGSQPRMASESRAAMARGKSIPESPRSSGRLRVVVLFVKHLQ